MNSAHSVKFNKSPVVTLLGVTRHTDNYGVRVLLSGAVEALALAVPEAEIAILDYGLKSEEWVEQTRAGNRKVRLINLRFSWRLHLPNNVFRLVALVALSRLLPVTAWRRRLWEQNSWLREILEAAEHFAIAGGDSFSDIYGFQRFLYVVLPPILVLLMKRPLVLLPQTYGPFRRPLARFMARWKLRRARRVLSRDEEGVNAVRSLTGASGPAVEVVPDLGFCVTPGALDTAILSQIEAMRRLGPIVGLNVSSLLYMGGYTGKNMFQLRESFPALINALVDHVVRGLGAQILLVPHVCGGALSQEDETRLCRRLLAEFSRRHGERVCYLDHGLDHRQMKSLIGQCDVFIGARMHACIGAVSQGVPSVCLAYSDKFAGVLKPLGTGAQVVDLRTTAIPEVLESTSQVFRDRERLRLELQMAIPSVREAVRSHFSRTAASGAPNLRQLGHADAALRT